MELTCENISKWFDVYFEEVGKNQGDIETVPKIFTLKQTYRLNSGYSEVRLGIELYR